MIYIQSYKITNIKKKYIFQIINLLFNKKEVIMTIFILLCNIIIPVIMIYIGVLYNKHSNKRINKILDLFIPLTMLGSGLCSKDDSNIFNDKNALESFNKKCGLIWFVSGLVTFIITATALLINKSNILNAITFLDTSNVSVIMLEIEFAIVVMVFISVEFAFKKSFLKR